MIELQSGYILFAGGGIYNSSSGNYDAIPQCQLYDPGTDSWQLTGGFNTARFSFGMVVLTDGQVLVTGGYTTSGTSPIGVPLASSEIYDITSGKWLSTGSMSVARQAFQMTALPDGTALACGGYDTSALSSCELYNPATGIFKITASMSTARTNFQMLLLPEIGEVLAAGGFSPASSNAVTSAELFRLESKSWRSTASMASQRANFGLVSLRGAVLAAGGENRSPQSPGDYTAIATAELFDITRQSWTLTGSLTIPRESLQLVALSSATGLPLALATGGDGGGFEAEIFSGSAELYRSTTFTWNMTAPASISTILQLLAF